MWWGNPTARFEDESPNLFVSHLPPTFDTSNMNELFSEYGQIFSCKVCITSDFKSKCYGFVSYDCPESATKALTEVDGKQIEENYRIFVSRYVLKKDRKSVFESRNACTKAYTNLYVKNFNSSITEDRLRKLFEKYGSVKNVRIMRNKAGISKGFAFVSFFTHNEAQKALSCLHEHVIEGTKDQLYVARAQRKPERISHAMVNHRANLQNNEKYRTCNVYVKNINDDVTEEDLRKLFSRCGIIRSLRIMKNNGVSRGFGFVCFKTKDQAQLAIDQLKDFVFHNKPLYVGLAQTRNERFLQRKMFINAIFQPRFNNFATRQMQHYPRLIQDPISYLKARHYGANN